MVILRIVGETVSTRKMQIGAGATVRDVLLRTGCEEKRVAIVVNGTQVHDLDLALNEEDEVLLVTPILGG